MSPGIGVRVTRAPPPVLYPLPLPAGSALGGPLPHNHLSFVPEVVAAARSGSPDGGHVGCVPPQAPRGSAPGWMRARPPHRSPRGQRAGWHAPGPACASPPPPDPSPPPPRPSPEPPPRPTSPPGRQRGSVGRRRASASVQLRPPPRALRGPAPPAVSRFLSARVCGLPRRPGLVPAGRSLPAA